MAHPLTFPALGLLTMGGVGLGLHLGNAAISEINPVYFQEPATRFHSDLSAYRSPTSAGYAAPVDAATPLELGTRCVGCRTFPEEYFPQRDPAVESVYEAATEEPSFQLAAAEAEPDPDLMRRQSDLDRLQRYASYAVHAQQEQEPAASVEASSTTEASAIQGDELAAVD